MKAVINLSGLKSKKHFASKQVGVSVKLKLENNNSLHPENGTFFDEEKEILDDTNNPCQRDHNKNS